MTTLLLSPLLPPQYHALDLSFSLPHPHTPSLLLHVLSLTTLQRCADGTSRDAGNPCITRNVWRPRFLQVQGEVHFEVSPDKSRPFEVYAGNRLVRAVGTAFSVRLDKDRVRVVVSEGIVDLAVVKAIVAEMEKELGSDFRTAPHADLRTKPAANINVNTALTKRAAQNSTTEVFGTLKAGESIEIPVTIKGVMDSVEYHDPKALNRQLELATKPESPADGANRNQQFRWG